MSEPKRNIRAQAPVAPLSLAVHLTYQCPLTCDHCCFSSDMHKQQSVPLADVLRSIDEATKLSTIDSVGFTGGDPFLQFDTLTEAIAYASSKGLKTRVVTSGYWATNQARALDLVGTLVASGLGEICLSYDDSHLKYVKESSLLHAYQAAEHFGIKTTIYISTDVDYVVDAEYVRSRLGVSAHDNPRLVIFQSQVTSTGRAIATGSQLVQLRRRARPTTYLGPCPSILRQPAITPQGNIMACCGTIAFKEGLKIGICGKTPLDDAVTAAYRNDLYKWIAFEGPVAVLTQITKDTDHPLSETDFDGICNACDVLFSSEKYQQLAKEYLPQKVALFRFLEELYSAAGHYRPPDAGLPE